MIDILKEVKQSALDKKGTDILALEVKKLSDVTDYFFIISAESERQLTAIKEEIRQRVKQKFGISPRHIEGGPYAKWIVMDYTDFIVHIFDNKVRDYYQLERLWGDAKIKEI
jgi:ribosome-associated protein